MNRIGQNLRPTHSSSTDSLYFARRVHDLRRKFNAAKDYESLRGLVALKDEMREISCSSSPQAVELVVDWLNSLWEVYKKNSPDREDIFCDVCELMELSAEQPLLGAYSSSQFQNVGELLIAVRQHATEPQLQAMEDLLTRFAHREASESGPLISSCEGSSPLMEKMRRAVDSSDPMAVIRIGKEVVNSNLEACEKLSILKQMDCIQWKSDWIICNNSVLVRREFNRLVSIVRESIDGSGQAPEIILPVPVPVPVLRAEIPKDFDYFRRRMNTALSGAHAQHALEVTREIVNSNLEFEDKYNILYAMGLGVLDPEVSLQGYLSELAEFKNIRDEWMKNV
ncbi:hypothetical protein [Rhizobacter sp. P5_C2]